MNKIELINILTDNDEEEEVFVKIDDTLYDVEVEHIGECFDGFETVYPACIALKARV